MLPQLFEQRTLARYLLPMNVEMRRKVFIVMGLLAAGFSILLLTQDSQLREQRRRDESELQQEADELQNDADDAQDRADQHPGSNYWQRKADTAQDDADDAQDDADDDDP